MGHDWDEHERQTRFLSIALSQKYLMSRFARKVKSYLS